MAKLTSGKKITLDSHYCVPYSVLRTVYDVQYI
jgi:hypothetical protein